MSLVPLITTGPDICLPSLVFPFPEHTYLPQVVSSFHRLVGEFPIYTIVLL